MCLWVPLGDTIILHLFLMLIFWIRNSQRGHFVSHRYHHPSFLCYWESFTVFRWDSCESKCTYAVKEMMIKGSLWEPIEVKRGDFIILRDDDPFDCETVHHCTRIEYSECYGPFNSHAQACELVSFVFDVYSVSHNVTTF